MAIIDIERNDHSIIKCDTERRTLSYFRYHVKFTRVEWKILQKLYEESPRFVRREDLIGVIWSTDAAKKKLDKLKQEGKKYPTRTVDVHISSIRKKIEYIKGAEIDSVYGRGYRLLFLSKF